MQGSARANHRQAFHYIAGGHLHRTTSFLSSPLVTLTSFRSPSLPRWVFLPVWSDWNRRFTVLVFLSLRMVNVWWVSSISVYPSYLDIFHLDGFNKPKSEIESDTAPTPTSTNKLYTIFARRTKRSHGTRWILECSRLESNRPQVYLSRRRPTR